MPGNSLDQVIHEALQGAEIRNPELILDFLRFAVESDAAYWRGETTEHHTPDNHVQSYMVNVIASGQ